MDERRVSGSGELQRAYQSGFLVVLVACFTPFKVLGYALPALFTAWVLLTAPHAGRNRLFSVVAGLVIGGVFWDVFAPEFLPANYLLAIVTYSSFLPILVIDSRQLASRRLLERLLVATSSMMLLQGVVGTIQAVHGAMQSGSFVGDNGDRVAGTIYPFLEAEHAFSNPMYAVNLGLMLIACLAVPDVFAGRRRTSLIVGVAGLVLASVVHALVFLAIAGVAAFAWIWGGKAGETPSRQPRMLIAAAVVAGGLGFVALRDNLEQLPGYAAQVLDLEAVDIPRAVLITRVITDLPDDAPSQPWIGLGPGQFSSRASLIASGLYLGKPDAPKSVPLLSPEATQLANNYCFSLLLSYAFRDDDSIGSTQQPFFSLLSVYTELGLVGLLLVALPVGLAVWRVRARARARSELRLQAWAVCAGAMFLALLGLQDNYWEVPQAILIGLLLLKVIYANVVHDLDDDSAAPGPAVFG